jgi:hypothetical protein
VLSINNTLLTWAYLTRQLNERWVIPMTSPWLRLGNTSRAFCLFPGCSETLEWPTERGRPRRFCDLYPHQAQYDTEQRRLRQRLRVADAEAREAATSAARKAAGVLKRQLIWQLLRYPDLSNESVNRQVAKSLGTA